MLWLLAGIILTVTLCYFWLWRPPTYWLKKGVKQGSPKPFFGDSFGVALRKCSWADMIQNSYNICPHARYVGIYNFSMPFFLPRDPELIKKVTVKDFDHFVDHKEVINADADSVWCKNLFALKGDKWRNMRSTLSPTFTSSKMKYMFTLISQTGEQFVNHFLKQEKNIIEVEAKDVFSRFTNDVIANAVFGVECDSLEDRKNEFYLMGQKITDFGGFREVIKLLSLFMFPKLTKMLGIRLFPEKCINFFLQTVKENIAKREQHGIVRPDMMTLLMEAKKNGLKYEENDSIKDTGFATVEESEIGKNTKTQKVKITDEDITAQALIFFAAGFETVSSHMVFVAYELAVNLDIQQRLIEEVDDAATSCNGKLTYETLLGMKYLDMVVSETHRKWPIQSGIDRECTKPYTIEPKCPDEVPVHLKKGEVLFLLFYGLHRDPQYYPEPDRFDPERFSEENKNNIKPYTYLPFGAGPRNCIGSRFALLETKVLFFHLLSNFEIIPIEKSNIPIKICTKSPTLCPDGGFWLGFKRRTKKTL